MSQLKCIFLLAIVFLAALVKADSPLTSTYFATFYYEYPVVALAESVGMINDEIAAYLLDENNPIDVKAAVINAMGWSYDGTGNAKLFKEYLAKSYGISTEQINPASLRADELMCLGYLMAMDDYFVVDDAIHILQMAADKKKSGFTIHLILCMTQAQKAMGHLQKIPA